MVQVQSTWFPVIDRNPQRFLPNIFAASDDDFRRATQRIYRSGQRASHIALPTVSGKPGATGATGATSARRLR
jgi:predicted acyl esterase